MLLPLSTFYIPYVVFIMVSLMKISSITSIFDLRTIPLQLVAEQFIIPTITMADDSTLLENTEAGFSITDSLIRLLWRCGTFFSGIVVLAAGVLYVKVSVTCIYVCLIHLCL